MVEWNNQLELTLIECYQCEPILWQSTHKDHKNKNKVHDAWTRISEILNIPVVELKRKKDSLMSSYRAYKKKIKDSTHTGSGAGGIYKPVWFAFYSMDSFLGASVQQCKQTINTEESLSECDNEVENGGTLGDSEDTTLTPLKPTVRRPRRTNPPEVLAAEKTVTDAVATLKETMNSRRIQEDDECDLHGKIIAKKLRKLPDKTRTEFVCEIYNMFLRHEQSTPEHSFHFASPSASPTYQRQTHHSKNWAFSEPATSYQRTGTSCSTYSEPPIYYTSIPEIHIPDENPTRVIITSNTCIQPAPEDSTNYDETLIDKAFNNA